MPNMQRALLAALVSAVAEAALPCPRGPLSSTAAALRDFDPAQAYCTAVFPLKPDTRTFTAATVTVTNTVSTITTTISGGSVTSTVTALPIVITSSIPASTSTVIDPLNTVTISSTQTTTITSFTDTTTTTVITTLPRAGASGSVTIAQRDAEASAEAYLDPRQSNNNAQDAALFASLVQRPKSQQGKVCTCLETRSATTKTRTPTVRILVTETSTVGGDATATITFVPTTTSTVTVAVSTITSVLTITTFDPSNTITSTISSQATAVATITIPANGPNCLATTDFRSTGIGGCTNNCYCDLRSSDASGFCSNGLLPVSQASNYTCTTDADCAAGATCASDNSVLAPAGTCLDFTGCFSTYDAATGTFPGKGPVGVVPLVPQVAAVSRVGRKSGKNSN